MSELKHFLAEYLRAQTDFAVLIKGKWGHGKTHALKDFIEGSNDWVYISLFGLKSTSEIRDQIFYSSNKLFGDKRFRFFSKTLAKMARVTIDADGDQGSSNFSIGGVSDTNLASVFGNLKDKKVILDDIERCKIDMNLFKGFVSELLDEGSKVVLVGNFEDNEVKKEDKNKSTETEKKYKFHSIDTFLQNKEKIVGATFELKANSKVLEGFMKKHTRFANEDLISDVQNEFEQASHQNLRIWKRSIDLAARVYSSIAKYCSITKKEQETLQSDAYKKAIIVDTVLYTITAEIMPGFNRGEWDADFTFSTSLNFNHIYFPKGAYFSYTPRQFRKEKNFEPVTDADISFRDNSYFEKLSNGKNPYLRIQHYFTDLTNDEWDRFVTEINKELKDETVSFSNLFQLLVSAILDEGTTLDKDWLKPHDVPIVAEFPPEMIDAALAALVPKLNPDDYTDKITHYKEDFGIGKSEKSIYFPLLKEFIKVNKALRDQGFEVTFKCDLGTLESKTRFFTISANEEERLYLLSQQEFARNFPKLSVPRQIYFLEETKIFIDFPRDWSDSTIDFSLLIANHELLAKNLKSEKVPQKLRSQKLIEIYDAVLFGTKKAP